MPVLDITEYPALQLNSRFKTPLVGYEPNIAVQQLVIAAVSAPSAIFNGATGMVRLHTDVACRIAFAATPVAAATSMRLGANQTEYFSVAPGMKVAVITTT